MIRILIINKYGCDKTTSYPKHQMWGGVEKNINETEL